MNGIHNILEWVERNGAFMLDDLTSYVEIETPSDDPDLLRSGLKWLQEWLVARVPCGVDPRTTDGGEYGDTHVVDFPSPDTSTRTVVALGHYDTVWPRGISDSWPVTIDGDTFSGPGAFDMKAGLVQLVWSIRACDELSMARPNIRIVLTGDEEIGSPASRPVIEREIAGADAVLVFEASARGAVKTARKGVGIFRVTIGGREAHAGLDPESGVNAIDELSYVIRTLHSATDLSAGTTVNVGIVSGGTRTNVTAGHAVADVDVRVSSESEVHRIDELLAGLAPRDPGASIAVEGEWNRPVMTRSPGTVHLYELARSAASDLGFDLDETSVGGASDGNFAAAAGLPVLDGLGAVGDGAHARTEWISIEGMRQRVALAAKLFEAIEG